jgi:hypothetical protein
MQAELGDRIAQPQSVVARRERGAVTPSFETLREAIRGCELELSCGLSNVDDSTAIIIDEYLNMRPAERFAD